MKQGDKKSELSALAENSVTTSTTAHKSNEILQNTSTSPPVSAINNQSESLSKSSLNLNQKRNRKVVAPIKHHSPVEPSLPSSDATQPPTKSKSRDLNNLSLQRKYASVQTLNSTKFKDNDALEHTNTHVASAWSLNHPRGIPSVDTSSRTINFSHEKLSNNTRKAINTVKPVASISVNEVIDTIQKEVISSSSNHPHQTDLENEKQITHSPKKQTVDNIKQKQYSSKDEILLAALDPEADEVLKSIGYYYAKFTLNAKSRKIKNYGVIRSSYQVNRDSLRKSQIKGNRHLLLLLDMRFYYTLLIDLLKNTNRIIIFMILDLFSDLILCINYLVELQWNDVHYNDAELSELHPRYLFTSRPFAVFHIGVAFSIFNIVSLILRTALADNKKKTFFGASLVIGSSFLPINYLCT